jgi:hypothetical protein
LATGGSSIIHGHADIVLTLPLLFFTTVIFMTHSSGTHGAPIWIDDLRLSEVVHHDVDEPGTKRAVLLRVLSLLALHWKLLVDGLTVAG